jgi:hypothetical protein
VGASRTPSSHRSARPTIHAETGGLLRSGSDPRVTPKDPDRSKTPVSAWGSLAQTNPPRCAGMWPSGPREAPARNEPNSGGERIEIKSFSGMQLPHFRAGRLRAPRSQRVPECAMWCAERVGRTNPPQPGGASTTGVRQSAPRGGTHLVFLRSAPRNAGGACTTGLRDARGATTRAFSQTDPPLCPFVPSRADGTFCRTKPRRVPLTPAPSAAPSSPATTRSSRCRRTVGRSCW